MEAHVPAIDPKLLTKLRSKKREIRQEAERQLSSLGPEAVPALLELLEKESANRTKRRRWGVVVVGLYVGALITVAATGHSENIGAFGGMTSTLFALFAATQIQKDAARVLAKYDDKRGVGRLAEALEYQDKAVTAEAEAALVRLLPGLLATDHGLLTPDQRRCLDRALVKHGKSELAMAILDAYEQVGDPDSVAVVERLAAGEVRKASPAVIRRAADVLPAMRVRAEAVRAAQTLLRPVEEVGADMLLRPVEAGPTAPVETLVRPVDADADISVADGLAEGTDRSDRMLHRTNRG